MENRNKNRDLAKREIKLLLNLTKFWDLIKSNPPLGGLRFNFPGLTPPWDGARQASAPRARIEAKRSLKNLVFLEATKPIRTIEPLEVWL